MLSAVQFYVTYPPDWEDSQAVEAAKSLISKSSPIGRVLDIDFDKSSGGGYATLLLEADPSSIFKPSGTARGLDAPSFDVSDGPLNVKAEPPRKTSMKPSQVSSRLRQIASRIQASDRPDRARVASAVRSVLAEMTTAPGKRRSGPWVWLQKHGVDPKGELYDVLNLGDGMLEELVDESLPRSKATEDVPFEVVMTDHDAGVVKAGGKDFPFTADMATNEFVKTIQAG